MNASTVVLVSLNALLEAIFADTDVPDEEEEWIERNETEAADAPIAEGDSPVLGS